MNRTRLDGRPRARICNPPWCRAPATPGGGDRPPNAPSRAPPCAPPGFPLVLLLKPDAEGSPGARLGLVGGSIPATIGETSLLLGGDILLEAMGQRLDSPDIGLTVLASLQEISPDTRVSVVILRSGKGLKFEAAASDLAPWLAR